MCGNLRKMKVSRAIPWVLAGLGLIVFARRGRTGPVWPVVESRVLSKFRAPGRPDHVGVDLLSPDGSPVRSPFSGVVSFARNLDAYRRVTRESSVRAGVYVDLDVAPQNLRPAMRARFPHGLRWRALHLQDTSLRVGDRVQAGQVIGLLGRTGVQHSATHLHTEIWTLRSDGERGVPVDPLTVFTPPRGVT